MIRSLRTQLLTLLLAIALVPLVISLGVGWWRARTILESELTQGLRAIATRQASLVNETVRELEVQTERVASSRIVVRALDVYTEPTSDEEKRAAIRAELEDIIGTTLDTGRFENFHLLDREGRLLYSARETGEEGTVLQQRMPESELTRVVERARTILETGLSDIRFDSAAGRAVLYSATPVFNQGRLLGVLALRVDPTKLFRGIDNYVGLGTTGETMLATQQGNEAVVVAPLRSRKDAAFNLRIPMAEGDGQPILQAVQGRRGAGIATDHRGNEVYAVWQYIPSVRWGIVVKVDTREAFSSVSQLGLVIGGLLLLTVLVVPLIAFHEARRLTMPILTLRDLTRQVAQGRFDVEPVVRTRNEIADLADSFREMTRRLRTSFDDLRRTTEEREHAAREAIAAKAEVEKLNAGLEDIVAMRTRELSERNAELQQTLDDLKRTQEQLIVREKMASLGELTAGVAHEISNPLNFVNNFSDLAVEGFEDLRRQLDVETPRLSDEARAEVEDLVPMIDGNLRRIGEHGRRAQRIVQGMIELTRTNTGERRPMDINRFVQEFARASIKGSRDRDNTVDVHLEFELDPELPEVSVFGSELSRALLNLMSNALWSVTEKSRQAPQPFTPHLYIRTGRRGSQVVIAVRDNGVGIPRENLARLFQPFFTTRPTGMGSTGLGLSMAWDVVVKQHGGALEVESMVGEFAEFRMVLPVG